MMDLKPALALPKGFLLVGLEKSDEILTLTVVSTQRSPCCLLCGQVSTRVHSTYTRQVSDLPCAGQSIRLLIQVRKYFCEESTCPRKIFAERLTPFIEPFARVTKRLCQIVQIMGLLQRWDAGCHNMVHLHQELVAQGYKGSYASVRDHLVRWLPGGKKNACKGARL